MGLAEYFYSVVTGPKRRRELMTPVGLLVFGATLAIVIGGGIYTDRILEFPRLLPGFLTTVVALVLVMAGGTLCTWCVVLFFKARGTPVPLNPPKHLVVDGPYAWVRNPMLTGVFAVLVGVGLLLHSIALVTMWIPAYAVAHAVELKWVEEPELERRFGPEFVEYRAQVPRLLPRLRPYRRPASEGE
jgi:protein-S-isoprenylcysteine O-methyltransferase Ste14